jgi:hypothetical protein
MCNTWFGFQGALCNQLAPQGNAVISVKIIGVVLGLLLAIWGAFLLAAYLRAFCDERTKDKKRLNPIIVTLLLASLGAVFISTASILGAVNMAGFPLTYVLIPDPSGTGYMKRIPQPRDDAAYILLGIGYCLAVCSMVLLPFIWVSLSLGNQPRVL